MQQGMATNDSYVQEKHTLVIMQKCTCQYVLWEADKALTHL